MRQLHAIVHGRVQGVSFRYNAQIEAQRLNLAGWVRNLPDRTVETLVVGDPQALEAYLRWLKNGPTGARVTRVDETWSDSPETYTTFEIRQGT